jgi:hypothetical protein
MSTSPHIPKPQLVKGRPRKFTLESLYEHIESLEKRRIRDNIDKKIRLLEYNVHP